MREDLFEEALVVVHLELALKRSDGVHRNTHHNQNRSATKRLDELVVGEGKDDGGNHRKGA